MLKNTLDAAHALLSVAGKTSFELFHAALLRIPAAGCAGAVKTVNKNVIIGTYYMKKMLISLALATTLTTPFVIAKEASSEKQANTAVQFRQAVLQLVRSNMGPLGGMAKGQIDYDAEVIRVNAMRIEQLALMMGDYFELDTRKFPVKTEAADIIWEEMSDFESKRQDMVDAAATLQKIALAKDESNYRSAIGTLGSTCKACHDKFKTD